eukprot:3124911-Heterocapsa_arctica.AAC.1
MELRRQRGRTQDLSVAEVADVAELRRQRGRTGDLSVAEVADVAEVVQLHRQEQQPQQQQRHSARSGEAAVGWRCTRPLCQNGYG